jgi:hypothetical protein
MESDIANFREQQALFEQSAVLGLSGYAAVSRHEVIEKRMNQGAPYLLQMIAEGKHEEAFALMESDDWMHVPLMVKEGRMKQTLREMRRQTSVTTQAIAAQAQLPTADVVAIEVGGYTSTEKVQRVVTAFNRLSGMNLTPEDLTIHYLGSGQ